MQCKFLIVFVLMGTCLIQATSAQPLIIDGLLNSGFVQEQFEKINNLIKKFIEGIQQQVNNALVKVNDLKKNVTEDVQHAIAGAQEKLQQVVANGTKQIDEIIERAKQAGVDIEDCIADSEIQFQNMTKQFLTNEIKCVTSEVDEVLRIINETVTAIDNIFKSLQSLPNEAKECLSTIRPVSCFFNISVEITKKNAEIPGIIIAKINEVTRFVSGFQSRLQYCAVKGLASAGVETAGIVGGVIACAAKAGLDVANL